MSNKILFLGDIMLGENLYHFRRGIRTKFQKNYKQLIDSDVKKDLFNDCEILCFNFEYSLVPEDYEFKSLEDSVYAAKQDSLAFFPKDKILIANIANNHFFQHGVERINFTIEKLKKFGFYIVGESNKPNVFESNNQVFKIWGVSIVPDKDQTGMTFKSDIDSLIHDIFLPKKEANDVWIISIHWGTEYIKNPDKNQIDLAHKLVDLGFDIIHGHHPHVIQPIEIYKNKPIMYSQGNTVFDQNFSHSTRTGLATKIEVDKDDIKLDQSYITKQHKFIVSELKQYKKFKPVKSSITKNKWLKKLNKLKYRVFMKIEFLPHIFSNNSEVARFLISRKMHKK